MKIFKKRSIRGRVPFITALILTALIPWTPARPAFAEQEKLLEDRIKDSIVKIYTTYAEPNYFNPWSMHGPRSITGSGCIITDGRILTNAHVVANHTFIQVQRHGRAQRFRARVLIVSHDADLALLSVDDETFFRDVTPLEIGGLPEIRQEVMVYGFPFGGNTLSITKGILSRIEHRSYAHSDFNLLAGQIDAAINPGNSGGPVVVNNMIVGIVMQSYAHSIAENLGYMVPAPVISHFLTDAEDGRYDGIPDDGLMTQKIENPGMKRKYGLTDTVTGILVIRTLLGAPAEGKIKKDDVLLAIDDHDIADDGTVEFRPGERTGYTYYIEKHQLGEEATYRILREGEKQEVTVALTKTSIEYLLVPTAVYDIMPRYFIFGGLIFSPLTENYLKSWGKNWRNKASDRLIVERFNFRTEERREVVIVIKALAADINVGYHDVRDLIVSTVNGKKIQGFDDLVKTVTGSREEFIEFTNSTGYRIIIDRAGALETHREIMRDYRIKEGPESSAHHRGE